LGVCLSNLEVERQLSLFEPTQPVHRAMDGIRERYGYDALRVAGGEPGLGRGDFE
jgi:hypothetical protein